jgi:hypothetical protein
LLRPSLINSVSKDTSSLVRPVENVVFTQTFLGRIIRGLTPPGRSCDPPLFPCFLNKYEFFLIGFSILFSDFSYVRLCTNSRLDGPFPYRPLSFSGSPLYTNQLRYHQIRTSRTHYGSCLGSGLNGFKGQYEHLLKFMFA